jgi:hypothetical protein
MTITTEVLNQRGVGLPGGEPARLRSAGGCRWTQLGRGE